MTVPLRAALYLRVSTARQAEHDVSIPDQKRQGEAYCAARGYELAETYVEPGASATNDRRPEFQRMIEAGTSKPAPFDIVLVHSFSRFFRDHFELEFYVRKLAKNGIKLVSITQEIGDDPMHVIMRQMMALFDEYHSKENGKHTLSAMKENARQGFWNGSRPPIGYRVVAAEQRGAKVKKRLEIDPLHADTVRLIDACVSAHVKVFVALAVMTGARKASILSLTWDRVDFEQGMIDFRDPGRPVTQKRRSIVPMTDELRRVLVEAASMRTTDWVIEYGGGPVPTGLRWSWDRVCQRAGLTWRPTPHHLKHSVASWFAMDHVPIDQAADWLATDPATLRRVYRKFDPAYLRTAARSLNI